MAFQLFVGTSQYLDVWFSLTFSQEPVSSSKPPTSLFITYIERPIIHGTGSEGLSSARVRSYVFSLPRLVSKTPALK